MKITGLVLAVVGLLGGLLCVTLLVNGPNPDVPLAGGDRIHTTNLFIPLGLCAIATVTGIVMLFFGGRGTSS